jgi:hypothetical protein
MIRHRLHILLCLAAALVAPLAAAETIVGSGRLVTETREVASFTGISLGISGHVELAQGDKEGLTVTADDNVLPLIETVVERNRLLIRWRDRKGNNSLRMKDGPRFAVSVRSLESIAVGGSGDVRAAALKAGNLKVSIGGSGNVQLAGLAAAEVSVDIGGSGDFVGTGRADSLNASIAGSGALKAGKLEAARVKVSIAGSGDAAVWARESLSVSVAGSGDVKYYGDPAVTRSIVGSGSVMRLGPAPA